MNLNENPSLKLMANRRSVKAAQLTEPAPQGDELRGLLTIAARIPDHGKMVPFRFIICDKAAQEELGGLFAQRFAELYPQEVTDKHRAFEQAQAMRAPLLIILVYQPVTGKIPHWEQELTVGAVGMNLLQTLHVAGYAGQWLTEWPAFDDGIHAALGLGEQDRIAGFFYIGSADTPAELREDRPRPDMDSVALSWQAWQAGEHKK